MALFVLHSVRDRCQPRVGCQTLRGHGEFVSCVLPARQFNLPELWQALRNPHPRFRCRLVWRTKAARRVLQQVRSACHLAWTFGSSLRREASFAPPRWSRHSQLQAPGASVAAGRYLLSTWMIGRFAEYDLKGRLSAVAGSPAPSVDNT